ncbi:MAG: hypothetical protein LBQ37_02900 [Elusimicrobiota bacterium]|jgi:cell division protein FtsL|nr:hypothetical protein [Elusimicrobiota bacterium]
MKRIIAGSLILFLVAFVYIFERSYAKKLDYKVSELDNRLKKVERENNRLKSEIDSILSIEKMHKIAEEKKLKRAGEKSIVRLNK